MATDHQVAHPWPAEPQGQTVKSMKPHVSLRDRIYKALVWGAMIFFLLNIVLLIATVAVNSIATRWFGTLLPQGFTLHWYAQAWSDFQLAAVLWVTVEVVGAVVLLSILLGVPAA